MSVCELFKYKYGPQCLGELCFPNAMWEIHSYEEIILHSVIFFYPCWSNMQEKGVWNSSWTFLSNLVYYPKEYFFSVDSCTVKDVPYVKSMQMASMCMLLPLLLGREL